MSHMDVVEGLAVDGQADLAEVGSDGDEVSEEEQPLGKRGHCRLKRLLNWTGDKFSLRKTRGQAISFEEFLEPPHSAEEGMLRARVATSVSFPQHQTRGRATSSQDPPRWEEEDMQHHAVDDQSTTVEIEDKVAPTTSHLFGCPGWDGKGKD